MPGFLLPAFTYFSDVKFIVPLSIYLIFAGSIATSCIAASVDTVSIFSKSMSREFKCVVIKPDTYKKKKSRYPVVYLLHGYSGDYSNWIIKVPELKQYADSYSLMIVCPDGGYASWYFDSKVVTTSMYETHAATEIPEYIDLHYKTFTNRNARAITGLSMGGHGALYLAWKHSDNFSAAGSMSGSVDLEESRNRFAIEKLLGDYSSSSSEWKTHSMLNVVDQQLSQPLSLIIDCGVKDFFIEGNRKLHQKLLSKKISHDYIERGGEHNWNYWKYAVHFQLLFFKKNFDASGFTNPTNKNQ